MKKTDLDEMIENPNEGLQVPENYLEVFTKSPTTKPEVPAPTKAEIEKSYFTKANAKQSLFCWALCLRLLTITCCPVAKYQFASYQHFGARLPLLCCIIRVGSFFRNGAGKVCKGFWVLPYWDSVYILAFCWYMIKAIETCVAGKKGMIGCKNVEPSNGGEGSK